MNVFVVANILCGVMTEYYAIIQSIRIYMAPIDWHCAKDHLESMGTFPWSSVKRQRVGNG